MFQFYGKFVVLVRLPLWAKWVAGDKINGGNLKGDQPCSNSMNDYGKTA